MCVFFSIDAATDRTVESDETKNMNQARIIADDSVEQSNNVTAAADKSEA